MTPAPKALILMAVLRSWSRNDPIIVVELQSDAALPPTSPALTARLQQLGSNSSAPSLVALAPALWLRCSGSEGSGSNVSSSNCSGSDGSSSDSSFAKIELHHFCGAITQQCGSDGTGSKLNVHHRWIIKNI
jgi:hypothetical protein